MYSINPFLRAECLSEEDTNIVLKIPLNIKAELTVWTEIGRKTPKNIYTSLNEIEILSAKDVGERWKQTGVCCVAAIAQNTENANKYILVLLPDIELQGSFLCSYQIIPFETPFKNHLSNKNMIDVVGICEDSFCSVRQVVNERLNVYPLHKVIFLSHPESSGSSGEQPPETQWDKRITRTNYGSTMVRI
jgi:hypothetical protein